MASNPILEEFATSGVHALARRVTDKFDENLNQPDDACAEALREELELVFEERINALNRD